MITLMEIKSVKYNLRMFLFQGRVMFVSIKFIIDSNQLIYDQYRPVQVTRM